MLAPEALRRIAATIAGGLRARAALDEAAEPRAAPARDRRRRSSRDLAPLAKEIDAASRTTAPICATARLPSSGACARSFAACATRVVEELRRLARAPGMREYLQEDFVTQRGGRPVLALKASARRNVQGIVHDSSGSGQTLFVEPFEIVELSNRQSEAAAAEREEAERILGDLSASVGASAARLTALVEAAGELDLALACGTLSRRWRGAPRGAVRRGAAARREASAARPCDGGADRPRPRRPARARDQRPEHGRQDGGAEDARASRRSSTSRACARRRHARCCRCSTAVLADIGDQQSIAMSLSTFSAHIAQRRRDPADGDGALARAASTSSRPGRIPPKAPRCRRPC